MIWQGNGVSPGVAVGPVYVYAPQVLSAQEKQAAPGTQQSQWDAYTAARAASRDQLRALQRRFDGKDAEKAAIFDAHLDLLDDEVIVEQVEEMIRQKGRTAAFALETVYGRYAQVMASMDDPTLSQRAADLADVAQRLLRNLFGVPEQDLSCLPGPVIVVADDLLPSDTASLDRENVLGIAAQKGGATSHSAIMARGWGIPAVLGLVGLLDAVHNGDMVVLDAQAGTLETEPDQASQSAALERRAVWQRDTELVRRFLTAPGATADGVTVDIGLNLGGVDDDALEGERATDFVGLLRTEFLYMDADHMPTEEEQYEAYAKALRAWAPRPVTVRTLDIGGDKTLPYFPLPKEDNPFLGLRALRLCFAHPEILNTQFRAALRAATEGELWLMLPMVSGVEEFLRARDMLEQARRQLEEEGARTGPVKLGVMIETPALVMMAPEIASVADFGSIGTNDLCQYLTAADRMNPTVAEYCNPHHPALYRAVEITARAFGQAGKPLCVCGELAGDERAACVLVGLGLRKLSMSFSQLARVKRALSRRTLPQMEVLAAQVLACTSAKDVLQCMKAALDA